MTDSQRAEPSSELRAEIIACGTELVEGLVADTNSTWISTELARVGIPTDYHTCVGDSADRLLETIRLACSRSDIVIISGGLGPTADDITREVVARAAGVKLVLHPPSLDHIAALFARWGRQMTDNNRQQAHLPEGAEVVPNNFGTAPGFRVKIGRAVVMTFPGVPRELYGMMGEFGLPYLRNLRGHAGVIRIRRLHCFGLGESQVDERVRHLMVPGRNPDVGLLVSNFVVTVRITARAESEREADALITPVEREVREIMGEMVFGVDGETMEEAVARELMGRGLTVALAESCTGGLVARKLANVLGISKSFLASVVTYSNEAKTEFLGVSAKMLAEQGAVSEPVARAMAEGVRTRTGADVAVSVTGIAGPTGGTPGKPVGLVYIGLADKIGSEVRRFDFFGDRERIRVRCALTALDMIRLWARPTGEAKVEHVYGEIVSRFGARARLGEPMSRHTTFRIGGPADVMVDVESDAELRDLLAIAKKIAKPVFILGNGSNTLVRDEGLRGIVVRLAGFLAEVRVDRTCGLLRVGGGAQMAAVMEEAIGLGFNTLSWAAGIPGTVGGCVAGNAGSWGHSTGEFVEELRVMTREGVEMTLTKADFSFDYREAKFSVPSPVIIGATLALRKLESDEPDAAKLRASYLAKKKASQPLEFSSAGSVFKNPPGRAAGQLIDQAGCKGLRHGGASVSMKHANFIVNEGRATASDVLALIDEVKGIVKSHFGVELEQEIRVT